MIKKEQIDEILLVSYHNNNPEIFKRKENRMDKKLLKERYNGILQFFLKEKGNETNIENFKEFYKRNRPYLEQKNVEYSSNLGM